VCTEPAGNRHQIATGKGAAASNITEHESFTYLYWDLSCQIIVHFAEYLHFKAEATCHFCSPVSSSGYSSFTTAMTCSRLLAVDVVGLYSRPT